MVIYKEYAILVIKSTKMFDRAELFAYNPHPDFGLVVFIAGQ
ncbi:MAG: hypothetical protein ACJAVI_004357 [Candidatus Azotimanducaceae bacterium]|jgi:hypothetical protein